MPRRRLLFALVAAAVLGSPASAAETRAVTDSAGRRVEVPARVTRVFAAGPPASILVFTLAPDTLLGWPSAFHVAPSVPFGWIDFPPSVNRLIGLVWLGGVLYPDLFPADLRREARTFYGLFYHQTPDDRLLDALFAGAARSGR